MKRQFGELRVLLPFLVLCLFLVGESNDVLAQQAIGVSSSYEYFPYAELADPGEDAEGLEIQTSSWSVGATFPFAFADGKIVLLNQFNYKRVDYSFRNVPEAGIDIEQAQSIEYTAFLIDSLSQRWKLVAAVTPGIASDFEGEISGDDFTLQAMFGFIRRYSENLSLGAGVAYVRDFGDPIPLPFVYFDWSNGSNFSATGIVPQNVDLSYKLNPKIDLGLSLRIRGNRYHGDPDIYAVDNPQMEYSEGTVSPMVQIHFLEWVHLTIEGGYAFYRNFEFLDGDKTHASYDLKETGYLRAGLVLGM
jgi:hypothetical protein